MVTDLVGKLKLKGHAKVELFRGGDLIQVEEGDNLITDYGDVQFWREMIQASLFAHLGINPLFQVKDSNYGINIDYAQATHGSIQSIVFSDYTGPESKSTGRIPGNVIGYATKLEYSGTDTQRGSINRNESTADENGISIVFDFGTDKANGTFQTIGLCGAQSPYGYSVHPYKETYKTVRYYTTPLIESDDGFYYASFDTTLYRINPATMEEVASWTLPVAPTLTGPSDCNEGYFVFSPVSSSGTLYSFKLADSTYTSTSSSFSYTYGIAVVGGKVYGPSATTQVKEWDITDLTLPITIHTVSNLPYSRYVMFRADSKVKISMGQTYNMFEFNTTTKQVIDTGEKPSIAYNTGIGGTVTKGDNVFRIGSASSYYNNNSANYIDMNYLTPSLANNCGSMLTHKLLASPVTKTDADTMKITYSLTIV